MPGDPLLLSYGKLSNDFLLMDYGFVVDDNPYDTVSLRFDVGLLNVSTWRCASLGAMHLCSCPCQRPAEFACLLPNCGFGFMSDVLWQYLSKCFCSAAAGGAAAAVLLSKCISAPTVHSPPQTK